MTSSGTTSFSPSIGELTLYAFGLCGIRRSEITQQHMVDARMAANLMLGAWGNSTPNLWKVSETVQTLIQGIATYNVASSVIMVLDAFIRTNAGTDSQDDRIIWPISRTEYASMPDKTIQAPPTVFWFDRLLSPTITMWQVPDGEGPYELHYYAVTQIFDANMPNGETPDLPGRWLDAFAWGLSARLSVLYAPDRAVALDAKAKESLSIAQTQDTENVPLYFAPTISDYYTR